MTWVADSMGFGRTKEPAQGARASISPANLESGTPTFSPPVRRWPQADPGKKHELLASATHTTQSTIINGGDMRAQLITYHLTNISQAEYLKQMVEPDAPVLAKVPGLISKIWLADEEKNTFGGFYLWENQAAMEDFMHSDLVRAVAGRPFIKDISSVDFEVNQNPSLITRGLK